MAKRKHPIHHIHKIKVHHNRWLLWAVSYALIVAIAVVGYIKITDEKFNADLTADSTYQAWHSYKDQRLGYSLRYPAGWAIEADTDSTVIFEPTDSPDTGVTVATTVVGAEKSIRSALNIASEKTVLVGGVLGVQIRNILEDDHYETVILVKHKDRLYVLRGTKNAVEKIAQTFTFTSK